MISEPTKQVVDVVAVGGTIGALIGWLPAVAAGATIVWTLIRIYETKTVKDAIARWFAG
jgi:chromate transport protein ChrA